MKNVVRFALALFLMVFISCSNDSNGTGDNDPTPTDDNGGQGGLTGNPRQDFPANFQATGSSGNDILSLDNFDRLVVEFAYVEGFRPTQTAVDAFEDFLTELSFKNNIVFNFNELESPNEETLTLNEIGDLELDNRTAYNDGSTLAIYIYFADAPSEDDDEDEGLVTLGAVYFNTSMVIFENTIRRLAAQSALITTTDIETATLNHEFGHLLGLVNLGTPTINDHEDTLDNGEGNNHCNVEGCLMRAELQFSATKGLVHNAFHEPICRISSGKFLKTLENRVEKGIAAPPVIDTECRLDIEAIGARVTSNAAKGY